MSGDDPQAAPRTALLKQHIHRFGVMAKTFPGLGDVAIARPGEVIRT